MRKLLLIVYVFLGMTCYSQTGNIQVRIIDTESGMPILGVKVEIINSSLSTISDFDGDFYFDKLPIGEYHLKFSFLGFKEKTIKNVQVVENLTFIREVFLTPFCEFENSLEKENCPICEKSDKVIPILYGFPSKKQLRKSKRNKILLAGCLVSDCDPYWYCRRDKKRF